MTKSINSAKRKPGSGLHDELNNFYSDIASLENYFSRNAVQSTEEPSLTFPVTDEQPLSEILKVATKVDEKVVKKKKKVSSCLLVNSKEDLIT